MTKKIAIEEHWGVESLAQLDDRLRDMNEAGIKMQILSSMLLPEYNINNASEAASWASKTNDELAEVVIKYPERFSSFAAISLYDPDSAVKELERAVTQLDFKGTITGTERDGFLDEPKYSVILEMAEKLDVPIYLHPKMPSPDLFKAYMTYPELAGAMWGFAAEAGLHAMRLICSGVFDRYPSLKIILGHMGEGIPYFLWRIDNQWEKYEKQNVSNAAPVFSDKLSKKPSQYFKENFYITTSGMFWQPALEFACSVLGADRILFAVDYPPESSFEAAEFIEAAQIGNTDKEKICHLNAEKLFRLLA